MDKSRSRNPVYNSAEPTKGKGIQVFRSVKLETFLRKLKYITTIAYSTVFVCSKHSEAAIHVYLELYAINRGIIY